MTKNAGRIGLGIDFNVNTASLNQIKSTLKELRSMSKDQIKASGGDVLPISDMKIKNINHDLGAMRKELDALDKAFEDAFNPRLGTYELNKFNESLKQSGTSAERAFQVVNAYGNQGAAALLNMTTNMLATDRAAKQVHSTFQKLGDTMMNTIRWSITSSAINMVTGAIQSAYGYAVDLDQSLNDIRIVTEKSSDEMERFARSANKAAKSLGASTRDYTDASLIYYQQGLSDADVSARTETTLKAAAITGQSADAVSEQLTAVWNGYKVSANEAELYIDKLSAVAATTAADLEELSTGMSKVASAANVMGVNADQLNAQLATIVSVTREAPESIGTALKTVYARMSDIESGLDTETTLGEYTSQMAQMGINVLDANEKLRDMGAVVEEIGGKWNTLNREQQVSLAQSIAGTRQYSRMMALFDNWDMYQSALTTSLDSAGALSRQHAIYLESIEGHQNKLKASAEGLYDSIFDSDEIKGVYDALSGIVEMIDHLVQALGGMPGLLTLTATLFTKIAKHNIADLIVKEQTNKLNQQMNKQQIQNGVEMIRMLQAQKIENEDLNKYLQTTIELEQEIYNKADNLTGDQWNNLQNGVRQYNELVQKTVQLEDELTQKKKEQEAYWKAPGRVTRNAAGSTKPLVRSEGAYYLTQEEDGVDSKGRNVMGLQSLEKKAIALREKQKKSSGKKAKTYGNEAKELEDLIKKAREENKVREESIKTNKAYEESIEKNKQATEQYAQTLNKTIDKDKFANQMSDVINGLTSIAFAATAFSSSMVDLTEKVKAGDASFEDWLGSISGITMSAGPLLISFFKDTLPALKAVKAGNVSGASAWTAYWGAATMGATVLITILTTVFSLIKSNNEALKESFKDTIEESNKNIEDAKKISDLATSYLDLYEAYKKTGEGKESLDSATEALLDTLKSEDAQLLKQIGDYEKLAEEIDNVRNKEKQRALDAAYTKKENAEKILDKKKAGNTAGIKWSAKDRWFISYGDSVADEDDKENQKILAEKLSDIIQHPAGVEDSYTIEFTAPKTAEEKVNLYNKLVSAKKEMENKGQTTGELYNNVTKFLEDEDWTTAVSDIDDAKKEIQSGEVWKQVESFGDNTSLSNFHNERERLISEAMLETGGDRDLAAALVDQQLEEYNSNTRNLLTRERSILAFEKYSGLSSELAEGLREENANISDAAFSALSTLDLENFSGSVGDLIKKAQEKAIELQDATWTAFGEERLKSLKKDYNDLGKAIDKSLGKDKINLIKEQNTNLEKQSQILKAISEDQQKDFEKKKADFKEKTGIDYTNPEQAKLSIENLYKVGTINEDEYAEYLTLLKSVTSAENLYNDALTDVAENQEEIYQNNIKIYETEIESIDTRIEKYQNLIDTLQSIADVYKLMYGENDFSKLTSLYEQELDAAKSSEIEAKNKIETLKKQLADTSLDPATRENLSNQLQQALGDGVEAVRTRLELVREAFINSLKSAVQTSVERTTGKSATYMENEWKYRLEDSEKYLDNVQKAYKIETLERDVLERINKLTNSNTRARINKTLQMELSILQKRDKLTEADVERAERKIKLLEAEIALEEARENKNQMRLMRGIDGTYSYQYVADQNAINERERALRDQQAENYNATKSAYMDNVSEGNALIQEYFTEMEAAGTDTELQAQIKARYEDRIKDFLKENQRLKAEAKEESIDVGSIAQGWFDKLASGDIFTVFQDIDDEVAKMNTNMQLDTTNDWLSQIKDEITTLATKEWTVTTTQNKDGTTTYSLTPVSASTGMYTGEWGPEGKVAILHEKELVLNKEDTANILRAVDLVRSLRNSMMDTVASMGSGYDTSMAAWELAREMIIEQTVSINAEFPNVTDRSEIEAAFDDLILLATQHAYEDVRGR